MKKVVLAVVLLVVVALAAGCGNMSAEQSDVQQRQQQEQLLQEATAQTGMPNIKNFRERKMAKDIMELRDKEGVTTYTYVYSPMIGKFTFVGESIGYGLPYSTQYTNPEKVQEQGSDGITTLPQADPNALFSAGSSEATWVMLKGPDGKAHATYIEERTTVTDFPLPDRLVQQ